jgi:TolB-like protein
MASLIPGYEYDIFISYRQKDNKGDGWVSEFVDNLKNELESTFKEEVSVYFDINPHDGLLETHDVDASLKEKLKCLVFIPIISRTYCDPKSFAWEHEFKAFIELASQDQYGLKVKLPGGNVASRVLPVQIHDLDVEDKKLIENELGGYIRGIEFIYKEPGVNKPLSTDDDEKKNLNNTKYRIQINKTANAIKDIILGLKKEPLELLDVPKEVVSTIEKPTIQEKSIIVLPFENISPDPDQEYFSDGLTEEIITDLSHIHDLLVISRSSAMTFKGTKKTIPEIARIVNVRYVLEGSVRKAGNNLRITAQLIDSVTDAHLWAEKYAGILDDVFNIQEKVSRSIVEALKIKLNPEEQKRISELPIDNVKAYEFYFKAKQAMGAWTKLELKHSEQLLQKGLEFVGENTLLYSQLGYINYQYWNMGYNIDEKCLRKAADYLNKIFEMEAESLHGYFLKGTLELAGGSIKQFFHNYRKVLSGDPNHTEALFWMCAWLGFLGKSSTAIPYYDRLRRIDPLNIQVQFLPQWFKIYEGKFDTALDLIQKYYESNPEFLGSQYLYIWVNVYLFRHKEAISAIDRFGVELPESILYIKLFSILKSALLGEKSELTSLDSDLEKWAKKDATYSYHIAQCFSLINEIEKALDWLEISINLGGINYNLLNENDPALKNIRSAPRFKKLMQRVKHEWQNFEV